MTSHVESGTKLMNDIFADNICKHIFFKENDYRKTSNIRRTLVGNTIVDHSEVVGASPVGAAPTTSSFSTQYLASMDWPKTSARQDKKSLKFGIWCVLY